MIHYNFDLSALNTLRLPAKAYAFARFRSVDVLLDLLAFAREQHLSVKVLGAGSNVLLAPEIKGLVLQPQMQEIRPLEAMAGFNRVAVEAGVVWHDWVSASVEYGHGLENLALIPGTVGAAPVQNIGAYGVEVGQFIESVSGIRISTQRPFLLTQEECQFAYRDSIFKQALANDCVITHVNFKLPTSFQPNLSYGPLQNLTQTSLTAAQLIAYVSEIRQQKLPDPMDTPNAGSFFKNPMIEMTHASELQNQYPNLPCYPQVNGEVKLAAAWLIEQCGFKGVWHGNMRMHPQQALVLTTNGEASFSELQAFKDRITQSVFARFNIQLEPEPTVF